MDKTTADIDWARAKVSALLRNLHDLADIGLFF